MSNISKFLPYLPIMQHATDALLKFRDERNWKQFHDPKNLAAALGIEAAELNEVFLWKTTEESRDVELAKVKEELADLLAFIDLGNRRIEEWARANE